jgi:hypothetical protein
MFEHMSRAAPRGKLASAYWLERLRYADTLVRLDPRCRDFCTLRAEIRNHLQAIRGMV